MAAAGGLQEKLQQALLAALQLLADVEAQIRGALRLSAGASIYDAAPEQLHSLPPAVLTSLESTLQVVQELRQQQQQQASSAYGSEAHAATTTVDSAAPAAAGDVPHGQSGMDNLDTPACPLSNGTSAGTQDSRVSSPASLSQRFPASKSSKRLTLQQHSSPAHLHNSKGSASNGGSTSTRLAATNGAAAAAAAATRSLLKPDASRQARAEWLAGKLQQQQAAASALERDLQREQQLLQKLADKKLAAEVAHAQVMREVRQLSGALQALANADGQWAAYLDAAKQELQLANNAT